MISLFRKADTKSSIKLPTVLLFSLFAFSVGSTPVAAQNAWVERSNHYFKNIDSKPVVDSPIGQVLTGQPIIWLVVDALRPDHLGCYGYERDTSPAIDALATNGLIFTRFFANAPWTRAATASMLSGMLPSKHSVQCDWHKLPDSITSVAESLKKAGYFTLAVVGNGNASSAFGLNQGFDVFEDTTTRWKGLPRAEQVFEVGLDLLQRYRQKKPIFLFLFVVDPHDPYKPKKPYDEMFLPGYKGEVVTSPRWEYNNNYPEPVRKKTIALYDGLIRYTDDQISDFMANLKKLGMFDQTSIFITSDHGEAFGEHGVYKHSYHLYETHIRIPLIVHAPWLREKARVCTTMFQQLDLYPTFCDLAGVETPPDVQGVSILQVLKNKDKLPVPRYMVSEYNCYGIQRSAIRTPIYKLIYQQPADREMFVKHVKLTKLLPSVSFDRETFLLYHLADDPYERKDIWSSHGQKEGTKLLRVLKEEISQGRQAEKIKALDPQLVEELRSLGYVQ